MEAKEIIWKKDGWTAVRDADAEQHLLGVIARAENGVVVEVRVRHNDGEETKGKVLCNGANALPMDCGKFAELFCNGELKIS